MLSACTEIVDTSAGELSEPVVATESPASGISVNYVNTSSYINSGFSFLNPTQINKNRVATGGSGYTQVYGFNVPEANRARGIRWNSDDETTNHWRPQGITGFKKNGKDAIDPIVTGISGETDELRAGFTSKTEPFSSSELTLR